MPLKLTRRPKGTTWHIAGTVAGIRVRETTGTSDKRQAEEYRATREAELYRSALHGEAGVAASVTWEEACLSYVETMAPSPGTRRHLLRLTLHFGATKLKQIDQAAVDRAMKAILTPGSSGATKLRNVIVPLSAVLHHSARRKWCARPDFERPPGAAGTKRTRWLTPAEYAALLDASAPYLRPLIIFLACTGARLGEALRLEWRDVDLAHGRATMRAVKSKHGVVRDRIVDLLPAARDALAAQRQVAPPAMPYVFLNASGRHWPLREEGGGHIQASWNAACRKAGFPGRLRYEPSGDREVWQPEDVTPHVMRHTWASWHYCVFRDLLRLKEDGLWSTVALVERYAKLTPRGMRGEILAAWGLTAAEADALAA